MKRENSGIQKIGKGILVALVAIGIVGCSTTIEKVTIDSQNLTLDINQEKELSIIIDPEDAELDISDFQSSQNDVIKIEDYKDHKLIIKSLSLAGSAEISYKKDDLKSNVIIINVIDKVADAEAKKKEDAEKQKIEEQKKKDEADKLKAEEAKQNSNQQKQTSPSSSSNKKTSQKSSSSKKSTSKNKTNQSSSTKNVGQMVYIPRTGKKYHSRSNCGNLKNPSHVSLSEAQSRGFTPCKKCY